MEARRGQVRAPTRDPPGEQYLLVRCDRRSADPFGEVVEYSALRSSLTDAPRRPSRRQSGRTIDADRGTWSDADDDDRTHIRHPRRRHSSKSYIVASPPDAAARGELALTGARTSTTVTRELQRSASPSKSLALMARLHGSRGPAAR